MTISHIILGSIPSFATVAFNLLQGCARIQRTLIDRLTICELSRGVYINVDRKTNDSVANTEHMLTRKLCFEARFEASSPALNSWGYRHRRSTQWRRHIASHRSKGRHQKCRQRRSLEKRQSAKIIVESWYSRISTYLRRRIASRSEHWQRRRGQRER